MIELTMLRYFTSAFESGTFSQAARIHGVSQPTVSAAIQKLEERLGNPLFHRSKAGLTPTPLARRLYHDAVASVSHLSTLEARLSGAPQRHIRLHIAPDMLLRDLAPSLNIIRHQIPNITFSFTGDATESDLAYLTESCVPDGHNFIFLDEEPFQLALSRNHPLATMSVIRLDDIRDQSLILRPYCPNADHLQLVPIQVPNAAQAMNDTQLLDLVAAGLGLAFVPKSHGKQRDDIILLPLDDCATGVRRIGISHRKSVLAKDMADRLIQELKH